jgi:RNA polymerase sigma factor (TIGR02999 family)
MRDASLERTCEGKKVGTESEKPQDDDLTRLLRQVGSGKRSLDELMELVYQQLRAMAAARMGHEQPDNTLGPTALVHEAYMKLYPKGTEQYQNRAHFFGSAARAMEQVLVEKARQRDAQKRTPGGKKVPLTDDVTPVERPPEEVLKVHALMDDLDERKSTVFRMWYFGGLSGEQISEIIEVSARTVRRDIEFLQRYVSAKLEDDA